MIALVAQCVTYGINVIFLYTDNQEDRINNSIYPFFVILCTVRCSAIHSNPVITNHLEEAENTF